MAGSIRFSSSTMTAQIKTRIVSSSGSRPTDTACRRIVETFFANTAGSFWSRPGGQSTQPSANRPASSRLSSIPPATKTSGACSPYGRQRQRTVVELPHASAIRERRRLADELGDDLYAVPELVLRADAGHPVLAHVVLLSLRQDHGDPPPGRVVERQHALRDVDRRSSHEIERAPQKAHVLGLPRPPAIATSIANTPLGSGASLQKSVSSPFQTDDGVGQSVASWQTTQS